MTLRTLIVFITCMGVTSLIASESIVLKVTVTGVTPNQGQISVTLFNSPESYLKKPLAQAREPVPDANSASVEFEDLAPGEYAASVYYDLDDDGELDTGMFRIPKEPVGFSNNAKGKFGPAKWKKTRFLLEENLTITIEVVEIFD